MTKKAKATELPQGENGTPEVTPDSTKAVIKVDKQDLAVLKEIDVKIDRFIKEYGGLTIKDADDNEGYELVRAAISDMRSTRTGLDDERKEKTEEYRQTVAFINNEYNTRIAKIKGVEEPLKKSKKEIDDAEELRKEQKKREEEILLNNRLNELTKAGCVFDGEQYSIGKPEIGVSMTIIDVVDIRAMGDDTYKSLLQMVLDKAAAIDQHEEKIRKEAEDKLKAEEEQRKKDQEEFDKKQAELKKQQEEFDEKQRKMNEQMERLQKARDNSRIKQLQDIGLFYNPQYNAYTFLDVNVDVPTELKLMEDDEWDVLIGKITPAVEERKIEKQKEEERAAIIETRTNELRNLGFVLNSLGTWVGKYSVLSNDVVNDLEADWQSITEQAKIKIVKEEEKERIARDNEIKEKALEEQREQDRKDREEKEAQLAQANDKTKWKSVIEQLRAITIPEMKSAAYKTKTANLQNFIQSQLND